MAGWQGGWVVDSVAAWLPYYRPKSTPRESKGAERRSKSPRLERESPSTCARGACPRSRNRASIGGAMDVLIPAAKSIPRLFLLTVLSHTSSFESRNSCGKSMQDDDRRTAKSQRTEGSAEPWPGDARRRALAARLGAATSEPEPLTRGRLAEHGFAECLRWFERSR